MVIIEGPDGSGKTTLLKQLGLERRTFKSMHGGVGGTTPNGWAPGAEPFDALVEIILNKQYEESRSGIKIGIDRLHLSEWVYGPILRNKQLITDEVLTDFSRFLRRHHIPVVLCLPPFATTLRNVSQEGRERPTYQTEGFLHAAYRAFHTIAPWATHIFDYTTGAPFELYSGVSTE
jgi:hypothetical protein